MDKETLEKLIADQPKEIRAKGVLLFNGAVDCAAAYQKTPTAATLRDYEASQAALAKFSDQLGVTEEAERPLPTIADVLNYLKAEGWRVTQTSLYRHQKEGKFLPQRDGSFARKNIDKYAKTFLKLTSIGKRVNEKMDELQRQKIEAELKNLDIERRRKELALDRDLGKLVPREQMEIELATRAGILDAGLKHWVKSHAAEWIRLLDGNMQKIGEFISLMVRELDVHINSYATTAEWDVIIDPEEEETGGEPETEASQTEERVENE